MAVILIHDVGCIVSMDEAGWIVDTVVRYYLPPSG